MDLRLMECVFYKMPKEHEIIQEYNSFKVLVINRIKSY